QSSYNPDGSSSQTSSQSYYNQGSSNMNPSQRSSWNSSQSTPSYQPEAYNNRNSWGQPQGGNRIAQSDTQNTQTMTEKKYPQDRFASQEDRDINARIRNQITGWFTDKYKNIAIITANGVVTITGNVNNNDDLSNLTVTIRRIDGVRAVN